MKTIWQQVARPLGLALATSLAVSGSAFAAHASDPLPRVVRAVPVPDDLSGHVAVTAPGGIPADGLDRLHRIGAYRIQQIDKHLVICQLARGARARIQEAVPGATVMLISDIVSAGKAPPGLHPFLRQLVEPAHPLEDLPFSNALPPTESPGLEVAPASASAAALPVCHNSEMMVGDLLVQIVFVQQPNSWGWNQWTEAQIIQVQYEIAAAFRLFQDASPVDISVIFRSHKRVPVRIDPIRYSRHATSWIDDAMTALGVGYYGTPVAERVDAFNSAARATWQVDWATTLFVVNAVNDWDGDYMFADSRVPSYGLLGGPYAVTPYPAGWLGFQGGVERSLAPKIGALFWCVDEQVQPFPDCDTRSGYLGYQNGNKTEEIILPQGWRKGCGLGEIQDCVMNLYETWTLMWELDLCEFSKGMLGFVDANENLAPDAFDVAPLVEFAGALAETLTTQPGKQRIQVIAQSLPNLNVQQDVSQRLRYAPPIHGVNVSVAGLSPYDLFNDDLRRNVWDIELPLPVLIPGFSQVTVTASNMFDVESTPLTKDITYVDLRFVRVTTLHEGDHVRIGWTLMGEWFGATFQVARRNKHTGDVVLVDDLARVVASEHGFTDFAMVDRETAPGVDYEYSVHGTIEMPHRAGVLRVERESVESEIRGSVARSESRDRLRVAPNPFHSEVWVTVDVPTIEGPRTVSPGQPPPPRKVSAAVYSVNGTRVTRLQPHLDQDGMATFSWNGLDSNGRRAAAGVYFIGVDVGDTRRSRKVLLLR